MGAWVARAFVNYETSAMPYAHREDRKRQHHNVVFSKPDDVFPADESRMKSTCQTQLSHVIHAHKRSH